MRTAKEMLQTAAERAAAGARRLVGKKAARDLLEAADEALVELGRAAEQRQRRRAVKRALKKAGKRAALVAAGAAAVALVRKAVREGRSQPRRVKRALHRPRVKGARRAARA